MTWPLLLRICFTFWVDFHRPWPATREALVLPSASGCFLIVHVKKNHWKNLFAVTNWAKERNPRKPDELEILIAPNKDKEYEKEGIMDVNLCLSLLITRKIIWVSSINVGFFDHVRREGQILQLLLEEGIQDLLIRWIEDITRCWCACGRLWQDRHVCWLASAEERAEQTKSRVSRTRRPPQDQEDEEGTVTASEIRKNTVS